MEQNSNNMEFYMFGKNFWKVPCMRNSLLYGISGGIGVGLLSFLLTSKAKQATKHMFGGYFAISIGSKRCRRHGEGTGYKQL
ncbi:hypothetical protein KM043_014647 [Ampulex compressa]|nr:hypothetical protein KM043_014647 [Ampulex compressa]